MALKILQSGINPLGQFDGLDAEVTLFKGGEVCTLTAVAWKGSDVNAADVNDGYSGTTSKTRPAVTLTLVSGHRPLFLADDGVAGYGTLFGSIVGGSTGQTVKGVVVGPTTATGSGKITIWDKPGLYAVTLDAVDTTASTGLAPSNTSITCGDPLYATAAGLLTPASGSAFQAVVVARFIEFSTNGSLVTTPASLTEPGGFSTGGFNAFTQAVIHFNPSL
jgi:hypothetical protein